MAAKRRKQPRKVLVKCPPKFAKPKFPDSVKSEVEAKAQEFIDSYLKPTYVLPPKPDSDSNYVEDIYARWYHSYFYFCSKYCCPSPRAIAPFFEDKFARMEYLSSGRFNLAFMRYTGQWWPLKENLILDECLNTIKDGPWFRP